MSPTCNRGAGREGGSRDGDRIRGRPRQWGEGARPGPGGGEPRGEVLRRIAAAGSWRCGCGGGGRQVSRRPRRVRAWRPHGRPRGARPCSLLPPPCLSACLPPPSISLSLSPWPSWDANEFLPVFSLFRGFFEFLPASMVALSHAAQMLRSSLTIYTQLADALCSGFTQTNFSFSDIKPCDFWNFFFPFVVAKRNHRCGHHTKYCTNESYSITFLTMLCYTRRALEIWSLSRMPWRLASSGILLDYI